MISGVLSAELSATCNALGYSSGTTYFTDPYVKETITDLIRYLRRDDEEHTIRRHLGSAKILQTDLLPILTYHSDKEELFDVILRLLVNLTNPALLIYQEEVPAERTARHYFLQLISQLQSYKEAFTQQRVWEILAKKLGDLLQIEYQEREEDQSRMMERILILARNVLQVPADPDLEKRPDNDASVHDQVLWSLHQAGMVDLFLYIATTDHEQQYYMHILEIVSLMLREQNPATLASAALQRSVEERERDEKELLEIRRKEISDKQSKIKKYAGSRHSRFGGTFVAKDVKSISDRDLIVHKPLNKAVTLSFDTDKQRSKVPKNKTSLAYHSSERRSAFSVRLFLKEFCVEFLNGAYNPLMYRVRENLVRAVGQPNDETYYFWAIKFFMEFNRLYKFQVKLISETMHQQIFHFVQTQMENWLERMVLDKKKIPIWSRRIHQALKAYQELLMTLQAMDRSPEATVRESARVIKSNIFYQSEYRELVIFLFNVYAETKFSRVYLKDLVETTHIFMKMLDHFCSRHQNLIVQGKPRKKQKKKKKTSSKEKAKGPTAGNLEAIWDQVGPELSAVLQGQVDVPTDIVPFDAASDLTMDQQKVEAMKKIQLELKQGNFEQAVGLLRASREVWPENDCFGHANMAADEEFLSMREIFMTDIGQPIEAVQEEEEEENGSEDDEEEDPRDIVVPEQNFKFMEFVGRFACPRVLSAVCQLLERFELNSVYTNHCAVKILHRVAWDCKMPAMLFQASLFRTFQQVFKSTNPEHKELAKFAVFVMRKFAETAKKNKKIYMELLFWKNKREAEELEVGYGNYESKSHSAKNVWREEQEDELRRLAAEYERDTPETDAVGWIMKNMIDQTRTRRAVVKKMKELYLVVGTMKAKSKLPKEFSEMEIDQLRSLYDTYKDVPDPMNCIMGRLSVPRSRRAVVNKMLELGIISDKKQLKKKSAGKKRKSGDDDWGKKSDDESIYDSSSDDDNDAPRSTRKKTETKSRYGQPSEAHMCCHLHRVLDADLREPLEWLQESLQEVLEDLMEAAADEDDEEGTALLPLTPLCVQAVDNPTFLQLLDILSLDKPTDQEVYWRIPGRWKAADLTKRIKLVKDALEDKLPIIDPDEIEELTQLPGIPTTSNSPGKKKKRLKNKSNKSTQESFGGSDAESSRQSSASSSEDEKTARNKSSGKEIINDSSSDEGLSRQRNSDDSNHSSGDEFQNTITQKSNSVKYGSDKDNDSIVSNKHQSIGTTRGRKKRKSSNEENTKSRHIDSDSEDELIASTQKSEAFDSNISFKRKYTDSSDSEDERISPSTKTSIASTSQINHVNKSKTKSGKVTRRKRISIESDSDDNDKNTSIASLTQSTLLRDSKSPDDSIVRRKRISIESESDDENTSITTPSQRTLVNNSKTQDESAFVQRKRMSIESDSDDSDKITSTASLSQSALVEDSKTQDDSVVKKKRLSVEFDDHKESTTVISTKTAIALAGRRKFNDSLKRRKKFLSESSDSDNEKNTTMDSTRTSIASSDIQSEVTECKADDDNIQDKSLSIVLKADNDINIASSSKQSEGSESKTHNDDAKRRRPSNDSESDHEKKSIPNSKATTIDLHSKINEVDQPKNYDHVTKRKRHSSMSDPVEHTDKIESKNTSFASNLENQSSVANLTHDDNTITGKVINTQSEPDEENESVKSKSNILTGSARIDASKVTKKVILKRKRFSIESESEEDDGASTTKSVEDNVVETDTTSHSKRKRLVIDSDSDNESFPSSKKSEVG